MRIKVSNKALKKFKDCEPGFYILASHVEYKTPTIFKVMAFEGEKYYCVINGYYMYRVLDDISEVVEVEILNVEAEIK